MSYSPFEGTSNWKLTAEGNFPQTLMQYDIAAIQRMYGANYETNNGNTVYRWNSTTGSLTTSDSLGGTRTFDAPGTNKIFMTVWDGGGRDTFNFSNYGNGVTVDLRPGAWTTVSRLQLADLDGNDRDGNGRADVADGNIAVALESRGPNDEVIAQYIENVIGTAFGDRITGNIQANTITSRGGTDTVFGGDGNDLINGGLGNDILNGQWGDDTFVWIIGEGVDSFHGGAGLGDTINILGGPGTSADTVNVVWNGTAVTGFGGTSVVTNVESIVADLGAGADTISYAASTAAVTVNLLGTASGFNVISNIENATGGNFADALIGNANANVLTGNSGADRITGGAGNDRMSGGSGSDTYFFGAAFGVDTITDFDSDPGAGGGAGFDLLNVRDLGINAGNFAARIAIAVVGTETQVTIDGNIIHLPGVTGVGTNAVTIADFSFV
jgi:serralysin